MICLGDEASILATDVMVTCCLFWTYHTDLAVPWRDYGAMVELWSAAASRKQRTPTLIFPSSLKWSCRGQNRWLRDLKGAPDRHGTTMYEVRNAELTAFIQTSQRRIALSIVKEKERKILGGSVSENRSGKFEFVRVAPLWFKPP